MKLLHLLHGSRRRVAVESADETLLDVTPFLPRQRPDLKALIASGPSGWARFAQRVREAANTLDPLARSEVRVLAPYANPGKILCVALNYRDHIRENPGRAVPEKPILFSKVVGALVGPGEAIVRPRVVAELDYEGELAVVVGRRAKRIAESEALGFVFGYSILNDVTARDLQRSESHWVRAKGGDTFAPFGPAIVTADAIADPQALAIRTYRNGQRVQDGTTADMLFGVRKILAFASEVVTLEPGDIVATGTPAGVGAWRTPKTLLEPGDTVRVEIPGIGALENTVEAED